jgi:hypothetical protein
MTQDELLAREAIRDTMARYNMAGDRARPDDFIKVFTEDGILEAGETQYQGRDAIHKWMTGWRPPAEGAAEPPKRRVKFVRHNLTTSQIDFTGPETATARTYFIVYTDIGPDHSGYYADTFRKVGDQWLIAHRKARQDWRSPESTFGQ